MADRAHVPPCRKGAAVAGLYLCLKAERAAALLLLAFAQVAARLYVAKLVQRLWVAHWKIP
jgi:hypothetical protein